MRKPICAAPSPTLADARLWPVTHAVVGRTQERPPLSTATGFVRLHRIEACGMVGLQRNHGSRNTGSSTPRHCRPSRRARACWPRNMPRAPGPRSRPPRYSAGKGPARCSPRAPPPRIARAALRGELELRLGRQAAAFPHCVGERVLVATCTTGCCSRPAMDEPGPSGARQLAPGTKRHQFRSAQRRRARPRGETPAEPATRARPARSLAVRRARRASRSPLPRRIPRTARS